MSSSRNPGVLPKQHNNSLSQLTKNEVNAKVALPSSRGKLENSGFALTRKIIFCCTYLATGIKERVAERR